MWETHACDLKGEKRKKTGNGKHFVWTDELGEDEEEHSFPESYATCFPAKKIAGLSLANSSNSRTHGRFPSTHTCMLLLHFSSFFLGEIFDPETTGSLLSPGCAQRTRSRIRKKEKKKKIKRIRFGWEGDLKLKERGPGK